MPSTRNDHEPNTRDQKPISQVVTAEQHPDEHVEAASIADFKPGWRLIMAVVSLMVITLMAAVDATSLSVALPTIARALRGTAIEAFWAGTSFLLAQTVFQPVIGAFSHIFGRKLLVYVSLAFFGAGAIVAALAKNFTVLLVGRTVQGAGGGGIIALTEIIMTDIIPLRERGKWFSAISSMWALGTVSGPLIGGVFAEKVTWTWIFWINLPIIGVALPMILLFLKLYYKPNSLCTKLRRVDWIGTIMFVAFATGFIIPISWGGVMYNWSDWRTLFPLETSAFGLLIFVAYEEWLLHQDREPMIQFSPLKNRTGAVVYLGTLIHGIVLWCLLYYMPLYYEGVKGYTPIVTGLALFPETFTVAPASIAAGVAIAVSGRYRWALWLGWVMTTVGAGLLAYLKPSTSVVQWIFLNVPFGLGCGVLFSAMAIATQAAAPPKDASHAVVLFTFIRSLGNTIGVAIGGVIFQNQMRGRLRDIPSLADRAEEYAKDASALVQVLQGMPDSPDKDRLREAYTDSLRWVWIVMCALSAVALAANLFARELSLDKALETDHGFIHQGKRVEEEREVAMIPPRAKQTEKRRAGEGGKAGSQRYTRRGQHLAV